MKLATTPLERFVAGDNEQWTFTTLSIGEDLVVK